MVTAGERGAVQSVLQEAPVVNRRDRYFDLLRAVAIVRVVAFHMFPAAWLSMAFPAMGVMFALGGSLMARSVDRSTEDAIFGRLRRLLPGLWLMGAVLVPTMLIMGWPGRPELAPFILWVLPLAEPPAVEWAEPATGVLWYLVTYLWLVLLSPMLLRMYRRARLVTVVAPLLLLAGFEQISGVFGDAAGSVGTDLLTFAACWVLGFAHRDGALRAVRWWVLAPVAVAAVAGGLYWAWAHPGEDGVDLAAVPLAYGVFSVGFVLVLLRVSPPMGWLARVRHLDGLVTFCNARAVTIYLWHNVAITLSVVVGDAVQVWRVGDRFVDVGYTVVAVLLVVVAVLLVGWVEDLAARRPVTLLPWRRVPPSRPRPRRPHWSGPTSQAVPDTSPGEPAAVIGAHRGQP
jgi:peptidoglycan/LPS O-acetylase OafA/YrhL